MANVVERNHALEQGRLNWNEAVRNYYNINDTDIPNVDGLLVVKKLTNNKYNLYIKDNNTLSLVVNNEDLPPTPEDPYTIPYSKMKYQKLADGTYDANTVIMTGLFHSKTKDISDPEHLKFDFAEIPNLHAGTIKADNIITNGINLSNLNLTYMELDTLTVKKINLKGSIDQYNVTNANITDQFITLNSGLTGNFENSTLGDAGIEVNRGLLEKVYIKWDELKNRFVIKDGMSTSEFTLEPSANNYFNEYKRIDYVSNSTTTNIRLPESKKLFSLDKKFIQIFIDGKIVQETNYNIINANHIQLINGVNIPKDSQVTIINAIQWSNLYKSPITTTPLLKQTITTNTTTVTIPQVSTFNLDTSPDLLGFLVFKNNLILFPQQDYTISRVDDNYTLTFTDTLVNGDKLVVLQGYTPYSFGITESNFEFNHGSLIGNVQGSPSASANIKFNRGSLPPAKFGWNEPLGTFVYDVGDGTERDLFQHKTNITNTYKKYKAAGGEKEISLKPEFNENDIKLNSVDILVFKNGLLLQSPEDFTINPATFSLKFNGALTFNDNVLIILGRTLQNSKSAAVKTYSETIQIEQDQNYIVTQVPFDITGENLSIFLNGRLLNNLLDYHVIHDNKVRTNITLKRGDVVKVYSNNKYKIYEKMDSTLEFDGRGAISEKSVIEVKRNNNKKAVIRWNELLNKWEHTRDGVIWENLENTPSATIVKVIDANTHIIDIKSQLTGPIKGITVFVNGVLKYLNEDYNINADGDIQFVSELQVSDKVYILVNQKLQFVQPEPETFSIEKNLTGDTNEVIWEINYKDNVVNYILFLNGLLLASNSYTHSKDVSGKLKTTFVDTLHSGDRLSLHTLNLDALKQIGGINGNTVRYDIEPPNPGKVFEINNFDKNIFSSYSIYLNGLLQSPNKDYITEIVDDKLKITFVNDVLTSDRISVLASKYFTEKERLHNAFRSIEDDYIYNNYGRVDLCEYYDQYLNKHYPQFNIVETTKTFNKLDDLVETNIPFKYAANVTVFVDGILKERITDYKILINQLTGNTNIQFTKKYPANTKVRVFSTITFGHVEFKDNEIVFNSKNGINSNKSCYLKVANTNNPMPVFGWNGDRKQWIFSNDGLETFHLTPVYYGNTPPTLTNNSNGLFINTVTKEVMAYINNHWDTIIKSNINYNTKIYQNKIRKECKITVDSSFTGVVDLNNHITFEPNTIIDTVDIFYDGSFMYDDEFQIEKVTKILNFLNTLDTGKKLGIIVYYHTGGDIEKILKDINKRDNINQNETEYDLSDLIDNNVKDNYVSCELYLNGKYLYKDDDYTIDLNTRKITFLNNPNTETTNKFYIKIYHTYSDSQANQGAFITDAPNDSKKYGRMNEEWTALTDIQDVETNDKSYIRKNKTWAEFIPPAQGISDAPNDSSIYGRRNNAWEKITISSPGGGSSGGIPEAPNDGKSYVRKSETWAELIDNVGLSEAPIDNKQYIRKNSAWTELVIPAVPGTGILEVPNDDKTYGRKNGTWVEIADSAIGIPEAPEDGNSYVRKNKTWEQIVTNASTVLEAPNDGKIYGRKNNNWVSINNGISDAPNDSNSYVRYNGGWNRLNIIDDLTSYNTTHPLSANQGRVLNSKIMPKPNSTTWVPLVGTVGFGGQGARLPMGGTWAYCYIYLKYYDALNIYTLNGSSGVAAGGTSMIGGTSGYGFAWKISD